MALPSLFDTMTTSKLVVPGDAHGYHGHQPHPKPGSTYIPVSQLEAGLFDETGGYKPNYTRRPRGGYRGGRGRSGLDSGRWVNRRRPGGEAGPGPGQYNTAYRGRGRERGGY